MVRTIALPENDVNNLRHQRVKFCVSMPSDTFLVLHFAELHRLYCFFIIINRNGNRVQSGYKTCDLIINYERKLKMNIYKFIK